jgi:3-phenylpropionate/trans-cinnamate dioxygenase ferredoxin component
MADIQDTPGTPFVAVVRTDSILAGTFVRVVVDERPLVVANVEGRFYACEDNCSHEDYPLSLGCLHGASIKCPLHGGRFSLEDGAALDDPAERPIQTFRCRSADGWVWIDPGPAATPPG